MKFPFMLTLSSVVLSAAAAGSTASAAEAFSFQAVEYLPASQRQAAANAFVTSHFRPGMSMDGAVRLARRAGTYCHKADAAGVVACEANSLAKHPGDELTDISWRLRLMPDASGALAHASVERVVKE